MSSFVIVAEYLVASTPATMRLAALFLLILPCSQAFLGPGDQIPFSVVTSHAPPSAVKQFEGSKCDLYGSSRPGLHQ